MDTKKTRVFGIPRNLITTDWRFKGINKHWVTNIPVGKKNKTLVERVFKSLGKEQTFSLDHAGLSPFHLLNRAQPTLFLLPIHNNFHSAHATQFRRVSSCKSSDPIHFSHGVATHNFISTSSLQVWSWAKVQELEQSHAPKMVELLDRFSSYNANLELVGFSIPMTMSSCSVLNLRINLKKTEAPKLHHVRHM